MVGYMDSVMDEHNIEKQQRRETALANTVSAMKNRAEKLRRAGYEVIEKPKRKGELTQCTKLLWR